MRIFKILFVPICFICIACASVPIQNSNVINMEETSIDVPKYKETVTYIYTLKDEFLPRTTTNRYDVPLPAQLKERPSSQINYQYGAYAKYLYEEVYDRVPDGISTVDGFQITLGNGYAFFINNTSQQKFQLKIGSNVAYQSSNNGTTIITVDGRKIR